MKCKKCGKEMTTKVMDGQEYFVCDDCMVRRPKSTNQKSSNPKTSKSRKLRNIFICFGCVISLCLIAIIVAALFMTPTDSNDSVSDEYIKEIDSYYDTINQEWENVTNNINQYDAGEITLDEFMGKMGQSNTLFLNTSSKLKNLDETPYSRYVNKLSSLYHETSTNLMNYIHEGDTSSFSELESASGQIITIKSDIEEARKKLSE